MRTDAMTAVDQTAPAVRPRRADKRQWGRAIKALAQLLADNEDTARVFEIMRALNGPVAERNYRRLLTTTEGGRIAYERVEFARRLMDDAFLDSLPEGSVGAAYRGFVRDEQLSAAGLVKVSQQGLAQVDDPHPYAWMGRRTRDVHDVWHVLTGYGRDALGEACLVAFSYAQTQGLGWAFIALGAAFRGRGHRQPYKRAILEGYLCGRRAGWLLGEDYEQLLREPLEAARQRLRLTPPAVYDAIPLEQRELPGKRR
jgi:ubiquinone biosynthesis protein COQ4